MKANKIINVILSGGSGTRLWPLSRKNKPKQFLKIFDDKSLFQHTVKRNMPHVNDFLIITNQEHIKQVAEQLKEFNIKKPNNIIEPIGRNTAPAIALAALSVSDDDILLVSPSDHMISADALYEKSLNRAFELAKKDNLVTFGVRPTEPNIGFGYIEYDKEDVVSFREKPDLKTANMFLEKGNFNWNSGIFCFKASVFLRELKLHDYNMYVACIEAHNSIKNNVVDLKKMENIPSNSIDYAILEKSNCIKTVSSSFKWTDLGTFDALVNYFEEGGNVRHLKKQKNTSSFSFSNKEVYTTLENLIIIDSKDSIVVLERTHSNEIKNIYNSIEKEESK